MFLRSPDGDPCMKKKTVAIHTIVLIRHAKTDMKWSARYDSTGFDAACEAYEESHILLDTVAEDLRGKSVPDRFEVLAGTRPRAVQTAHALYDIPEDGLRTTPLLDEVPMRSFKDTDRMLPLWLWEVMARVQWFFGSKRQPETRKMTKERISGLIALLESEEKSSFLLISHGFYMRELMNGMRRRGFNILRRNMIAVEHLERVRITPRDLHCGGCRHNCMLTNPGCDVGRDKARRLGFQPPSTIR